MYWDGTEWAVRPVTDTTLTLHDRIVAQVRSSLTGSEADLIVRALREMHGFEGAKPYLKERRKTAKRLYKLTGNVMWQERAEVYARALREREVQHA